MKLARDDFQLQVLEKGKAVSEETMCRLSGLTLAFALLSAFFLLIIVFFRTPFALYPLMSLQDALDLLTPLVLVPIYWLMFKVYARDSSSRWEEWIFVLFAVLWMLGHGMHLSANSINNLIASSANQQGIDIRDSEIQQLTHFYDEILSHILWHVGVLGLAGLLAFRSARQPAGEKTIWWAAAPAGVVYGATLFCLIIEGNTTALGFPFTAIAALVIFYGGLKRLSHKPILAFFFISFLAAALFISGWGLYWGGFPEFSEVGLI